MSSSYQEGDGEVWSAKRRQKERFLQEMRGMDEQQRYKGPASVKVSGWRYRYLCLCLSYSPRTIVSRIYIHPTSQTLTRKLSLTHLHTLTHHTLL
jgi:hypothetical protein